MTADVKNQPASALPWGDDCISVHRAHDSAGQAQDETYARHATNAYPRLVEALSELENNCRRDDHADAGSYWRALDKATALLLELGEA